MMAPEWLLRAMDEPKITDILLNGSGSDVFINHGSGLERLEGAGRSHSWDDETMRTWVVGQLSTAGRSWDAKHPFMDATLPSGHRMHVTFPPISRVGILVSLRRLPIAANSSLRWASSAQFPTLVEAVRRGDSMLISGATGSGKTTLASDLLAHVSISERILALEDTPELAPAHPHFLTLLSRPPNADGCGEVSLRTLLKQTLRMRPDRIVLGECRGAEVLELLQALNTGHRGAMATLHANSPRDALRRVELLCILAANGTIPLGSIRELLANGIQWMIQVRQREDGNREISELWHLEGREGDTILMRQVV